MKKNFRRLSVVVLLLLSIFMVACSTPNTTDAPNPDDNNPKIIGPLSDIIYMRYGRDSGNENVIKYFWNENDVRLFGTNRFEI